MQVLDFKHFKFRAISSCLRAEKKSLKSEKKWPPLFPKKSDAVILYAGDTFPVEIRYKVAELILIFLILVVANRLIG